MIVSHLTDPWGPWMRPRKALLSTATSGLCIGGVQCPLYSKEYNVCLRKLSGYVLRTTITRLVLVQHQRISIGTRRGGAQGVPTPTLPSSTRGKAGRNNWNEEFTPLLPTGIGERLSQTISNLGHAALLRRCELSL